MPLLTLTCAAPVASFTPSVNPDYGDGYGRVEQYHQPARFCGGLVYSYSRGKKTKWILGWPLLPTADLTELTDFFEAIGQGTSFTLTDVDGVTHTVKQITRTLTWEEAQVGFYEVSFELEEA